MRLAVRVGSAADGASRSTKDARARATHAGEPLDGHDGRAHDRGVGGAPHAVPAARAHRARRRSSRCPAKSTLGADYDTEWARRYPARLARVLVLQGLVKPGHAGAGLADDRRASTGSHDLEGPAIFAANHHSHVDTPLVLSVDPRAVAPPHVRRRPPPTTSSATRSPRRCSALVIGAIPIERNKVGRKSADDAAELLDDGWSMLIFPEGGRSPDGWGQPFRGGAAYLSLRCERAGRAGPRRGHRSHPAQGPDDPDAVADHGHVRAPLAPDRRRGLPPVRRPHRGRGRRAGRRGRHRLVAGPQAGRTPARRPRCRAPSSAPGAAPGRSATAAPSAAARRRHPLARPLLSQSVPGCRRNRHRTGTGSTEPARKSRLMGVRIRAGRPEDGPALQTIERAGRRAVPGGRARVRGRPRARARSWSWRPTPTTVGAGSRSTTPAPSATPSSTWSTATPTSSRSACSRTARGPGIGPIARRPGRRVGGRDPRAGR